MVRERRQAAQSCRESLSIEREVRISTSQKADAPSSEMTLSQPGSLHIRQCSLRVYPCFLSRIMFAPRSHTAAHTLQVSCSRLSQSAFKESAEGPMATAQLLVHAAADATLRQDEKLAEAPSLEHLLNIAVAIVLLYLF